MQGMLLCSPNPARWLNWYGKPVMSEATEKQSIRSAFDRAADHYDRVAEVQRRIARNLLGKIPSETRGHILDAGCGTGFGTRSIRTLYPGIRVTALDVAYGMCHLADPSGAICADMEALPFADASFELYWSSLAWQWTSPLRSAMEAARVLRQGGLLRVATLGPRTMYELKEAFAQVDTHPHVRRFESTEIYSQALASCGFTEIRIEQVLERTFSAELGSLMRDIRTLGAHVLDQPRRRGLLGRQYWERLQSVYENHRESQGLPVSYDTIYLSAVLT
jgi:malonyl-CoA O-methyltransferase